MKVGDMITNKTRYINRPSGNKQKFLVVEVRDAPVANGWIGTLPSQVRAIRMPDGLRTRWCTVDGWEVISESR